MASEKILIVEDSPTMRRLYTLVLGVGGGRELLFAHDGAEGLDRAAQEPDLDLLIVDINMPVMDGLTFLRRLRGDLGRTGLRAIVISTEGTEQDRAAAMDAGATAFLAKPWTPDALIELVESTLREAAHE